MSAFLLTLPSQSPSGTFQVRLLSRTPSPSPRGDAWIRVGSGTQPLHDYRHVILPQSTPRRVVLSPSLRHTTAPVAAGPGSSSGSRATAWQVGFGHLGKQGLPVQSSTQSRNACKEPASNEAAQSRPSTPLMRDLLDESNRRCEQPPPQLDSHEQNDRCALLPSCSVPAGCDAGSGESLP
jgi:hypothetical protein